MLLNIFAGTLNTTTTVKPNHHTLPIILGAIGGVLAFLILSGLILCYVNHRRGPKQPPLDYASGKLHYSLIGYFVEESTLLASDFPTCRILILSLLVSLCRSWGLMLYNNFLEPFPCLWRAVAENSSQRDIHSLKLTKSVELPPYRSLSCMHAPGQVACLFPCVIRFLLHFSFWSLPVDCCDMNM